RRHHRDPPVVRQRVRLGPQRPGRRRLRHPAGRQALSRDPATICRCGRRETRCEAVLQRPQPTRVQGVRHSAVPVPADKQLGDFVMKTLATLDRPGWLPSSAWPWETYALNRPEGRIAVTDTGEGPTLLFVHVGSWSFVWRDVLLRLQNDFRCVT